VSGWKLVGIPFHAPTVGLPVVPAPVPVVAPHKMGPMLAQNQATKAGEQETQVAKANSGKSNEKAAPATIVVNLPVEAKLYFNNSPTDKETDRREFVSPPLGPGMVYEYTLRAELVVDGKTQIESRTVQVRAGQKTSVFFPFPTSLVNK
jgi:uncharacterized protein (TIGR03000 family)